MNTQPILKDYYCPFCNAKLFRGNVKDFKMVCQNCNRLVDSAQLPKENEGEKPDQADGFSELAE